MIYICCDMTTKLTPLEYILNNDGLLISIDNIESNKYTKHYLDDIIDYLNYYGIIYNIKNIQEMRFLDVKSKDLKILNKDQLINLLNAILEMAKDVESLEVNIYYDLGYNPYQE